jgi:predicted  nucleic acid-binding Zn-ribbon protein
MDREIQQLRQEKDRYKSDYEKSQILLQHANKKISDNSIQLEEMAQAVSNSQRVSMTTSAMRTSNMYGSKAYDPNYRGEAFGK